MKRNKPLRSNPEKIRAWQARSAKGLKRSKKIKGGADRRSLEETSYAIGRAPFLAAHPICPVNGEPTCQVHHSAKREGRWLNLQRYWIAVSAEGHRWIEDNKKEAEKLGLMVRIRETASEHIASLIAEGISLHEPVFYEKWNGEPFYS